MRSLVTFIAFVALALANGAWAEGEFVDLYPKTKDDIMTILETLEGTIETHDALNGSPIVMMLHGKEAHRFVRGNYSANKAIVDQTAKLAAHNVIEVRICETWLRNNNYESSDLFPFVSPVPYGVAELKRLEQEEGYTEYKVSL